MTSISPEINYYELASFIFEKASQAAIDADEKDTASTASNNNNSIAIMDEANELMRENLQKVQKLKELDAEELSLVARRAIANSGRFMNGQSLLMPGLELLYMTQSVMQTMAFAKEKLTKFLERADLMLTTIGKDLSCDFQS